MRYGFEPDSGHIWHNHSYPCQNHSLNMLKCGYWYVEVLYWPCIKDCFWFVDSSSSITWCKDSNSNAVNLARVCITIHVMHEDCFSYVELVLHCVKFGSTSNTACKNWLWNALPVCIVIM